MSPRLDPVLERPLLLLISGASAAGKSYMTQHVLGLRFDVVAGRTDALYALASQDLALSRDAARAVLLRRGPLLSESLQHRFYEVYEKHLRRTLADQQRWGVPVVLEGVSLGYEDERALVRRVAAEVLGEDVRVVHVAVQPSLKQWIANLERRFERRKIAFDPAKWTPAKHRSTFRAPTAVEGVENHTVTTPREMRTLAEELEVPKFAFYQGFSAGALTMKGSTNSNEKVDAIDDADVVGRTVLDLCCNSGVSSILTKTRGANRVVGVERNNTVYRKSLQLGEILRWHGDQDPDVTFIHGDMFEVTPTLGRFDTVLMFAAMHYFPDYERILRMIAEAARTAAYIEISPTDHPESCASEFPSDVVKKDQTPGVLPYTRATTSGMAAWLTDSQTMTNLVAEHMPGFEVADRRPISKPRKKDPSDYREVWVIRRNGQDQD